MAYWSSKDYKQSLYTLYDTERSAESHFTCVSDNVDHVKEKHESMISHVFNFYTFLKYHPLILKLISIEDTKVTTQKNAELKSSITPIERRLHFIAAYYHLISGCPLLTLDVLSKLPKYISNELDASKRDEVTTTTTTTTTHDAFQDDFADFSSNANKKVDKADDFDWGASDFNPTSLSKRFDAELELDLRLDSDSSSDSDSEKEDKTTNDDEKKENLNSQTSQIEAKREQTNATDSEFANGVVDTFAQQIKFISCLKILIEEMSTLATGFEVVGGQLR